MAGRKSYPRHLGKPTGRGLVECQASGFVRPAGTLVGDVRQGQVSPEFADTTPGFGTRHPQDVVQLGPLDDPRPIDGPTIREPQFLAAHGISDAEMLLALREGRPPRKGY